MKPTVSALALNTAATLLDERKTKLHGASLPTWRKNSTKRRTRSKPKRVTVKRNVAMFTQLYTFAAAMGSFGVVTRPSWPAREAGLFVRLQGNDRRGICAVKLLSAHAHSWPLGRPRPLWIQSEHSITKRRRLVIGTQPERWRCLKPCLEV